MNDVGVHIALFLAMSIAIVGLGVIFSEADDAAAARSFPRRWLYFVGGCLLLAGVMLALEHTVARVA